MQKILYLWKRFLVASTISIIALWSTVFAADPTVDQLLDLILNDNSSVATSGWNTSGENIVQIESTVTSSTPTEVITPVSTTEIVPVVTPSSEPTADDEFKNALTWMYANWLTQFSTPNTYEPYGNLTRQQAAKFFVVMIENVMGKKPVVNSSSCTFSDGGFDPSLRPFVDKACAYWILVGSNWLFRPNAKISRPEFVTALVRMIEWAKRDETWNPWWIQYYQQARDWNLTKEKNANAFDVATTRYEAALFLYRSIAVLKQLNIAAANPPSQVEQPTTPEQSQPSISPSTPAVSDPILQEAIYWMHDNWMTKYTSLELYRPFDTLQRQEAAKIFTLFRNAMFEWAPLSTDPNLCAFDDLSLADQTLVSYIKQACKLQILKWSNNVFNPEALLTKPQAVAILVRMIEGVQTEAGANRWQVYYDKAVAMWMIEPTTPENFDKPISRYEIAKILYNSKVKFELVANLNNDYETNKLIYPVPNTQWTWTNSWEIVGLVSINTQALSRTDIDTFVVDLFGNQYKIERVATQKHLNNDYVWYGKMLSIDETKEIWTVAFTISNWVIISGVLRPYADEQANFSIKPSKQQPYYDIVKQLK